MLLAVVVVVVEQRPAFGPIAFVGHDADRAAGQYRGLPGMAQGAMQAVQGDKGAI